jgi:hypothetical protein
VAGVGSTMRWYEQELGFKGHPFAENEPHAFGILVRDKIEIMLQRIEGYRKPRSLPEAMRRRLGCLHSYARRERILRSDKR